jgi:radical SAM superfamily enzyme YgiQ (UPF0313 family)
MKSRPLETEYAKSFQAYVSRVPEPDVLVVLERQPGEIAHFASRVSADREKFRYGEGKWSIREVVGHLIDGERVFAYRALCISRGEKVSLPAFDESSYIAASHYDDQPLAELVAEFTALRKANITMFRLMDDSDWERIGTANNNPVSVRALAYIIAGHVRHHIFGLRERYGIEPEA